MVALEATNISKVRRVHPMGTMNVRNLMAIHQTVVEILQSGPIANCLYHPNSQKHSVGHMFSTIKIKTLKLNNLFKTIFLSSVISPSSKKVIPWSC